jgi:excisionase family DNA binding protein
MPHFLTIREAAEALRCSQKHIRRLLDSGRLEFVDIGTAAKKMIRVKLPEAKAIETKTEEAKRRKEYVPKILTKI